ncbi:MAG: asparaginase, partial [Chloroflexi bacterium]|nr:asparaginase [Chloroflexota bacterium]
HRGSAAVVDTEGRTLLSIGNPAQQVFLRSGAKPFQVLPAILAGGIERFGLTERELAVLCASHSGEPRHLEAVAGILAMIGLDESVLHCGTHPPLDEASARRRWRAAIEPTPICNNCSGAHTGMLLACRARDWPLDGYGSPGHPLQRQTRELLAAFAGIQPRTIGLAVDNCAVPTFRLPLHRAATAFARLVTGDCVSPELARAARRVVSAMTAYPEMVGGANRFDTDLMRAGAGSILAKGGAEAFHGVGLPRQRLGIALKITDGNARAVPPATMRLLGGLGALDDRQLRVLAPYGEPELHNLQDEPVGRLVPLFSFGGEE